MAQTSSKPTRTYCWILLSKASEKSDIEMIPVIKTQVEGRTLGRYLKDPTSRQQTWGGGGGEVTSPSLLAGVQKPDATALSYPQHVSSHNPRYDHTCFGLDQVSSINTQGRRYTAFPGFPHAATPMLDRFVSCLITQAVCQQPDVIPVMSV